MNNSICNSEKIPTRVHWNDIYLRDRDFEVALGKQIDGEVLINLNRYPHILISGMTGSGKTMLLKSIMWQCAKKDAELYIADIGNAEYESWKDIATILTDTKDILAITRQLKEEMMHRFVLFRDEKVLGGIAAYNRKHPYNKMRHIIFAMDDVNGWLETSGLSEEACEMVMQIEQNIASIARFSKACGIHLIMVSCYPSPRILKSSVRNNLPIRISGRTINENASSLVLGNKYAMYIPDIPGRMLVNIGAKGITKQFQAYYLS